MLAVIGGGGIVVTFGTDLTETVQAYDEREAEYLQLQCLGDLILDAVPADRTIYMAHPTGTRSNYWYQRMIELSYPERTLTEDRERADAVVWLDPDVGS